MREVHEKTGWALTILVGGPMPENGGRITSTKYAICALNLSLLANRHYNYSLHIGRNAVGNTFGGAFEEFEAAVVQPFQMFLRNVFRESLYTLCKIITY